MPLTIVVHEFGHALAARAVGMRVLTVIIGSGPLARVLRRRRPSLVLRRYLLGGGITIAFHSTPAPKKWRQAIYLMGGIGANLAVAAVGAVLLTMLARVSTPQPFFLLINAALVTSQMIAVVGDIVPRRLRLGRGFFSSDGKLLIGLLRARNVAANLRLQGLVFAGRELVGARRYCEAERHYEQALSIVPGNALFFGALMNAIEKGRGPGAALDRYRAETGAFAANRDRPGVAWVEVNAAWCAVLIEDPVLLPLADRLSEQGFATASDAAEMQRTRGAVLVRLGNSKAGIELLAKAIRHAEPEDKADFARFLAEGERGCGNLAVAEEINRFVALLGGRDVPGEGIELGFTPT